MAWTRRELLQAVPLGIAVGLAGCNSDDDTGTSNTTGTSVRTTASGTTGTTSASEAPEPTGRTSATPAPTGTRSPSGESGTATPPPTTANPAETGTPPGTGTPLETGRWATSQNGSSDHAVGMYTGLYFDPVGLFVEPGETVAFENVSGSHSATAFHPDVETYSIAPERRVPTAAAPWNTEVLYEPGATRTVTFETEGTYDYFCIPHVQVGMVGRIVVGEPGGPATEGPNPYASAYPLPDSARIVADGAVAFDAVASE